MKRLLTFILTIVLLAETISPSVVYAQEVPTADVTSEREEIVNEQQPVPEEENTENVNVEGVEQVAEEIGTEPAKTETESTEIETEPDEEVMEPILELERGFLNYIFLDETSIQAGETQNIVVSMEEDTAVIENAKLTVLLENGEEELLSSIAVSGNAVLFTKTYGEETESGTCRIASVEYASDGVMKHIDFLGLDMDPVSYSVNREEMYVVMDVPETQADIPEVVTIEEGLSEESADAIAEAITDAVNGVRDNTFGTMSVSNNWIVVLDPGHDDTHAGAHQSGLEEEDLNLKIAQYCKKELERYHGVTVYMTRAGEVCPHSGTKDPGDCNAKRVDYAKSINADIYVSIHLNSSTASSANGAEVYYPNDNYVKWIGDQGEELAQKVQKQLVELGLNDRGIKIRNSGDNTQYKDGSLADYYGVIKRSKESGFPAVIIEHAFMTNSSDVNKFLSSDSGLKKLGIADATGIAKYLELEEVPPEDVDFTYTEGTVKTINEKQGSATIAFSGISPADKLAKVRFAVWGDKDGKNDLKWYTGTKVSDGNYEFTFNVSSHKLEEGIYHVTAYTVDIYGIEKELGAVELAMTVPELEFSATSNADETVYTLNASGVTYSSSFSGVKFEVWSEEKDRDDVKTYTATKDEEGSWVYDVKISNHKSAGTYKVKLYVVTSSGTKKLIDTFTFEVNAPEIEEIVFDDLDSVKGTFKVKTKGLTTASGVSKAQVKVWTEADGKNDIKTYTMTAAEDGEYEYPVNISGHSYEYGLYNAQVYITTNTGIKKDVGTAQVELEMPECTLTAEADAEESVCRITASGVAYAGGYKEVKFEVWSEKGGKDDKKTYTAKKDADNNWYYDVKISNHKTAGVYNANTYVITKSGSKKLIKSTTFEVKEPIAENIVFEEVNSLRGSFVIRVSGLEPAPGINKVQAKVWTENGGTNDRKTYTMVKDENGDYVYEVNIGNHNNEYDIYNVQIVAETKAGVKGTADTVSTELVVPEQSIETAGSEDESIYTLTGRGVSYSGGYKEVKFEVWSEAGGKDDKKTYTAKRNSEGEWVYDVKISNHKTSGIYRVNTYIVKTSGTKKLVDDTASFAVTAPYIEGSIGFEELNPLRGSLVLRVSGLEPSAAIGKAEAKVWCEDGGNKDKKTYTMTKDASGDYICEINVGNHNNEYGIYHAEVTMTTKSGIKGVAGNTSAELEIPEQIIGAEGNEEETIYTMTGRGVSYSGGFKNVKFEVWSEKGGKDDKKTYTAKRNSDGEWVYDVKISSHKTAGTYQVNTYIVKSSGTKKLVGNTTFEVTAPNINGGSLGFEELNPMRGTLLLRVSGLEPSAAIEKVQAKVWCEDGGNKDSKTYTLTQDASGDYVYEINVGNHNNEYGIYQAEITVTTKSGIKAAAGSASAELEIPEQSIGAAANADETIFTLSGRGVSYSGGFKEVKFEVWSEEGGKNDKKTYTAKRNSDGEWVYDVKISNHKTAGTYQVNTYIVKSSGTKKLVSTDTFTVTPPSAEQIVFDNLDINAGTFTVRAENVMSVSGISKVQAKVWTEAGGTDDRKTYTMTVDENGDYIYKVNISNHKYEYGNYVSEVYVTTTTGINMSVGKESVELEVPECSLTAEGNADESIFTVTASGVSYAGGYKGVKFAVWSNVNGQDDLEWYSAKRNEDGDWVYNVKISNHKNYGVYNVHMYVVKTSGAKAKVKTITFEVEEKYYEIMGTSNVTVDQMVAYYNANATYPKYYKENSDVETIKEFCELYKKEAEYEGVKVEVAFCQAMKETGFLRYGGDVRIEQFNFCGLGATGGVPGNSFSSIKYGIRAQIQHLKAYASTQDLIKAKVDPRFDYVRRGCAPYVEWLGQKENPDGYGWATAKNYGYSIVDDYIKNLKTY